MKEKLREKAKPMTRIRLPYLFILFYAGCSLITCSRQSSEQSRHPTGKNPVIFEDSVQVKYAEGFRISYHKNYKLLEILNPYQDKTDTLQYILKPRSVSLDTVYEDAQVIDIPVQSMIASSTTHIGLTDMLGVNDIITGMVSAEYVYDRGIRERVASGEIAAFSQGGFNNEQALAMDPDLVMVSGGQSSQFDDYQVLMDSGIGVLINSEWLETTPLGKAEWVKMMAALVNKEKLANKEFSKVESRYLALKNEVSAVTSKPLVINNMPYKGAWFVSGGNSFEANYLKAAGADYPWFNEKSTGGLRKDFEVIYEVGLRADIWLNPGAARSKAEILAKDPRFKDFKSFQNGQIYNNNKRMSPEGGNDFWESGVVHPERLLADLIHIMHPNILPDHTLFYYQKLGDHE